MYTLGRPRPNEAASRSGWKPWQGFSISRPKSRLRKFEPAPHDAEFKIHRRRPHLAAAALLVGRLVDARQLVGFDDSARDGFHKAPVPERALEVFEHGSIPI